MLTLDGSQGEGGGQILRSALALSMLTGTPFQIQAIRAGRPKPGLARQHLTAAQAAAQVCSAELEGAEIGSRALAFRPGEVRPGEYRFAVGSAGSASLVLQTVLPALLTAEGPSALLFEGGTHNPHAPPVDFLQHAFAPLVERMGPRVVIELERYGFYPVGGGRFTAHIEPVPTLQPIELNERGALQRVTAQAIVAGLPHTIGERELAVVGQQLGLPDEALHLQHLPHGYGPGNVLMLRAEFEQHTALFTGFGERRVRAETVAQRAIDEAQAYLDSPAVADRHLADQLLLPFSLAGAGSFTTLEPTLHTRTNIDVIQKFLPVAWSVAPLSDQVWQLRCERR